MNQQELKVLEDKIKTELEPIIYHGKNGKPSQYPIAMFGLECRSGWYETILQLILDIKIHLEENRESYPEFVKEITVDQIKEKFGGLRFYTNYSDKTIDTLISEAEEKCWRICEFCGSTEDIGHTTGWITTICKKCHDSDGVDDVINNRKWLSLEDWENKYNFNKVP